MPNEISTIVDVKENGFFLMLIVVILKTAVF